MGLAVAVELTLLEGVALLESVEDAVMVCDLIGDDVADTVVECCTAVANSVMPEEERMPSELSFTTIVSPCAP